METEFHESADSLEDAAVTQEAISETGVQEVSVCLQDIVNGGHSRQLLLKGAPIGLQHLHGHVVLEALDKVEHPLQQGKGWDVPSERESVLNMKLLKVTSLISNVKRKCLAVFLLQVILYN